MLLSLLLGLLPLDAAIARQSDDRPGGAVAPRLVSPDWTSVGVSEPPALHALAAILVDADTDTVLYELNADRAVPPASLTKLVAIEAALQAVWRGEVSLDESFAVPEEAWAVNQPAGSSLMFLGDGQRVTIRDLLYGLAVSSGNDAAVALALRIDGSVSAFAERMLNHWNTELARFWQGIPKEMIHRYENPVFAEETAEKTA